jgi:hypothetical protein
MISTAISTCIFVGLISKIYICRNHHRLFRFYEWQDSFERDEKPERERDIEMGHRNPKNNSDYGLENFFEEVRYLVFT